MGMFINTFNKNLLIFFNFSLRIGEEKIVVNGTADLINHTVNNK